MRFVTVALDDFDFDGSSNVVGMPLDEWSAYNQVPLSTGTGPMSDSGRRYNPVEWPDVAMTSGGDWIAVWQDDRDNNNFGQIKMRGYSADGAEWIAERTVNANAKGDQGKPCVGVADDGRFVVAWADDADGNGLYNIRMRGFNRDGSDLFAERRVNSVADGNQGGPAIAMASNGDFVVVWCDDRNENGLYELRASGFTIDGAPRFEDIKVNAADRGDQLSPAVAINAARNFVVAWVDDRNENGVGEIRMRRFHPDGSALFGDRKVNTVSSGEQWYPSVAIGNDDSFIVTWVDDKDQNGYYNVYMRGFWGDGTERFHDRRVNQGTASNQTYADIGTDGLGRFVIVWFDMRSYEILHNVFSSDGVREFPWDASVFVSNVKYTPAVAVARSSPTLLRRAQVERSAQNPGNLLAIRTPVEFRAAMGGQRK